MIGVPAGERLRLKIGEVLIADEPLGEFGHVVAGIAGFEPPAPVHELHIRRLQQSAANEQIAHVLDGLGGRFHRWRRLEVGSENSWDCKAWREGGQPERWRTRTAR